MSIELKHLRYAEVAERCGSFRKAADSLSLKQSNLSRRVRHLEDQLGIALFERTSGGVRATTAGRDFFNGVRRVLNDLQIVVEGAKAVGRGEAGYLTIGFYTSLSAGNLRASLIEYGRRFPQVEISTVEGSRSRLFDGIQNGAVDASARVKARRSGFDKISGWTLPAAPPAPSAETPNASASMPRWRRSCP